MKKIILVFIITVMYLANYAQVYLSSADPEVTLYHDDSGEPYYLGNFTICENDTKTFTIHYYNASLYDVGYWWIDVDNHQHLLQDYTTTANTTLSFSLQITADVKYIGVAVRNHDDNIYPLYVYWSPTVLTAPTNVSAGNDITTCNSSATLSASTYEGATGTWSGGNGVTFSNVNDPNATVYNLPIGNTTLTWTLANSCGTESANTVVTRLPEISFATQPVSHTANEGEQVIFSAQVNNATSSTTYQWKKDGVSLSNGQHYWGVNTRQLQVLNITSEQAGNYVLYVNGECNEIVSMAATLTVNTTGISNIYEKGTKVYPNPCSSNYLHIDTDNENVRLEISDITGKIFISKILKNNSNTIDVSKLNKGTYIVKLINENQITIKKLIKN